MSLTLFIIAFVILLFDLIIWRKVRALLIEAKQALHDAMVLRDNADSLRDKAQEHLQDAKTALNEAEAILREVRA